MAPAQELRYACTDGADSLPVIRTVVAEFERGNPGITVRIEPIVDNYKNKLLALRAANLAPDVARMGFQDWRAFAERDALVPLGALAARDRIKLDDWYPNTLAFSKLKGELYMLPRSVSPTGLVYYNRRLLREAGFKDPDPDWTWSYEPRPELGNKCYTHMLDRLTKRNAKGKPIIFGGATAWPQLWFDTLLLSRGLTMWDSNENPTKLTVERPDIMRVFRFASDTINEQRWIPSFSDLTTGNTNAHDEFVKGRVAMYQSGAWEVLKLRKEMKDEWDVAAFPRFAGSERRGPGEGNGTVIFNTTKHKEAAWKFVKWMSGEPGQRAVAIAGADMPAIRRIALSEDWLGKPGLAPANLRVTDVAAQAISLNQTPEWFADVASMAQGSSYDVLTGIKKPEKVMADLKRKGEGAIVLARRLETNPPYPFGAGLTAGILLVIGALVWIYAPERGRRLTRTEKGENRSAYLFLLPWFGGLGMTLGPMIYSLLLSFAESDIIRTPRWRGLGNYADALNFAQDDTLLVSLKVTFAYAAISIPLGIAMALSLALLLNQKVRGVPLWRALYYLPSLASGVAVSLIWMKVFNPDTGLLNGLIYGPDGDRNLLGIGQFLSNIAGTPDRPINWLGNPRTVLPAFILMGLWGAGGGTIIFLAGLQGISQTYYEAALLDGAGTWQRFRRVTFPLLTPTVFFSVITGVIGALQVFTQAFVITDGGPDRATMFTMLHLYKKAFVELKMGYASALAWILFAIILAITVIQLAGSRRWVHYEGELR